MWNSTLGSWEASHRLWLIGANSSAAPCHSRTRVPIAYESRPREIIVHCPAGTIVVAGGFSADGANGHLLRLHESAPRTGGTGWSVTVGNDGDRYAFAYGWAVCAPTHTTDLEETP